MRWLRRGYGDAMMMMMIMVMVVVMVMSVLWSVFCI